MNEEKLNRQVKDAVSARRELEQTDKAFVALEALYVQEWTQTGARDTDARERLWQAVQIVQKVKSHLEAMIANGKVAEKDLARLKSDPKILGIIRR